MRRRHRRRCVSRACHDRAGAVGRGGLRAGVVCRRGTRAVGRRALVRDTRIPAPVRTDRQRRRAAGDASAAQAISRGSHRRIRYGNSRSGEAGNSAGDRGPVDGGRLHDRGRRRASSARRSRVRRSLPRAGGGWRVDHRPWVNGGGRDRSVACRSHDSRDGGPATAGQVPQRRRARSGTNAGPAGHVAGRHREERRPGAGGRARIVDRRDGVRHPVGRQRRHQPSRRITRRAVGGDRRSDPDRRSRRARPSGRAATAGSRHVSRHRHLRRQHRDPRRPCAGPAVGDSHSRRLGGRRRHRAAGGVRLHRRRRPIGDARDGDGGDLPCAARHRSANGADARDGRHARRRPDRLAIVDRGCRHVAHVRRHRGDRGRRVAHQAAAVAVCCGRLWRWCSRPSRPRSH